MEFLSLFFFWKLFKDDIRYLLTMDKLWRKRKPPVPLDWAEVQSQGKGYILVFGTPKLEIPSPKVFKWFSHSLTMACGSW